MTDDELRQAISAYREQGQTRSHIYEMLKPPGDDLDFDRIFEQVWSVESALRVTPQQASMVTEDDLKRD
jgi:hypothetical protein